MHRLTFVAALVLAGCGKPDAAVTPEVPERVGRADLSIGRLEGPEEYVFGRISGVAADPDGLIYVSDALESTIRVFDGEGGFVRTIGRRGEGPREFETPCCIGFGPGGRLWVRDSGNSRYVSYDLSQDPPAVSGTVRAINGDPSLYAPITFEAEGQLVDVARQMGPDGALGLWRFTVALDGTQQDRVLVREPSPEDLGTVVREETTPGEMARYYFPQPFGPRSLVAHGPGGRWATAVSSQYRVFLYSDGTTVEVQGSVSRGPNLSPEEQDRASALVRVYVERGGGTPSDYPPIPDRKTPLAGIYFDVVGRLWVELSVPQGQPRRADVYDAAGTLVERRAWPERVSLNLPAWLGEGRALGISTDSLGVQRVVRVRFEE